MLRDGIAPRSCCASHPASRSYCAFHPVSRRYCALHRAARAPDATRAHSAPRLARRSVVTTDRGNSRASADRYSLSVLPRRVAPCGSHHAPSVSILPPRFACPARVSYVVNGVRRCQGWQRGGGPIRPRRGRPQRRRSADTSAESRPAWPGMVGKTGYRGHGSHLPGRRRGLSRAASSGPTAKPLPTFPPDRVACGARRANTRLPLRGRRQGRCRR
jgi:hypothetical protein